MLVSEQRLLFQIYAGILGASLLDLIHWNFAVDKLLDLRPALWTLFSLSFSLDAFLVIHLYTFLFSPMKFYIPFLIIKTVTALDTSWQPWKEDVSNYEVVRCQ